MKLLRNTKEHYWSKFKLGNEPEMAVLDRGDRLYSLNRGDKPDEKLKDNADKDSDWPKLILNAAIAE